MIRSAASKVMWVGRATVFLVGLAVILALLFGVTSTAFAHGKYRGLFHLGHNNPIAKVTTLVGNVTTGSALVVKNPSGGSALGLEVNDGKAPLTVNATAGKATNLNADKLDGKDVSEIGVNGLGPNYALSLFNSKSPKEVTARCRGGEILVDSGFVINGGKSGDAPNAQTDVVINEVEPSSTTVSVEAYEETPTSADWYVKVTAVCATAP